MLGKYLDISTSHLKEETLNSLSENKMPYSYDYKEGVFISVPDKNVIREEVCDLPSDLLILLNYAWENGISLIRLDADGEVMKNLPVYEGDMPSENEILAKRIVECGYNEYDEMRKRNAEINILNALDKKYIDSIKVILVRLCKEIDELKG